MTILWFFVWSLLKIIVVTVIFLMGVAYTVLLERKLVARIQNRWGPSRVGPFGLLQPLVDGAKSFLKEDLIPTSVYKPLYLLAPLISLGCALISIAVVPFGNPAINYNGFRFFEISDVNVGLLVILGSHVDRRVWDCAFGVVVEQQVFAAGLAAFFGAVGEL